MTQPDSYRIARETAPHCVEFLGMRHAAPWTTKTADASHWETYAEASTMKEVLELARRDGRLFIVAEFDTTDGPAHAEAVEMPKNDVYDNGSTWDEFYPSRETLDQRNGIRQGSDD